LLLLRKVPRLLSERPLGVNAFDVRHGTPYHESTKSVGLAKSRKTSFSVIPVKTGIQGMQQRLDSRLRGSDIYGAFLRAHQL